MAMNDEPPREQERFTSKPGVGQTGPGVIAKLRESFPDLPEAPCTWVSATTCLLSSGLYERLLGIGASASLAMVCIIFIVHTTHDSSCYLNMGLPRAYCTSAGSCQSCPWRSLFEYPAA